MCLSGCRLKMEVAGKEKERESGFACKSILSKQRCRLQPEKSPQPRDRFAALRTLVQQQAADA
jgi:hypothetical protein